MADVALLEHKVFERRGVSLAFSTGQLATREVHAGNFEIL